MIRIVQTAVVGFSLAALAVAQGPPPSPVRVDAAVAQEVQEKRRVTGEIRAVRRSVLAAREPGLVAELLVREGQRIEAGQVLARLDGTLLEAELRILTAQDSLSRAVLGERAASAALVRYDLEVLEGLAKSDAVNPKEFADARTAVDVANARLEQARQEIQVLVARRELLAQRVADMSPKAPFTGYVVARHVEAGEWVAAGGALVELSADELEAWLDVPQAYYAAVSTSSGPVEIDADVGVHVSANGWRVVPSIQASGRSFPLIAPLPKDLALAAGMSLTAEIATGKRARHLTVARDAVLRGDTGPYVYVAQPGAEGAPHVAMFTPVEVLFYTEGRVAVRAGNLAAGALVVVEGNERLFPTAPVVPRTQDAR